MNDARTSIGRHRGCLLLLAASAVAFSSYIEQVESMPAEPVSQWPSFPRRNIAALARDGYLRNSASNAYKRGISTLAKNGLLPTYRSPYVEADKQDQNQDESQEKRNMASIARLRSYAAMKRNIQALARDGYRVGRGQYNPSNDKRNIAALARSGLIHKKDEANENEDGFSVYQNPIDEPFDVKQSNDDFRVHIDMLPSVYEAYKIPRELVYDPYDYDNNSVLKRSFVGSPVHGMYRPIYYEPGYNPRPKRYVMPYSDILEGDEVIEQNDIDDEKRSVGSIPLTRISELGNISLVPKLTHQSIQTTPTYRRRQYLLTRTRPVGSSTDR